MNQPTNKGVLSDAQKARHAKRKKELTERSALNQESGK